MKTAILDSSVWVSFILKTDKFKFDSEKIIKDLIKRKTIILIPLIVVIEICAAAKRTVGKNYNFAPISAMLKHPQLKLINLSASEIYALLEIEKLSYIKANDYLILLYCLRLKPDYFLSFDFKQREVYNLYRSKKNYE